ncbi:cubilin [Anabrus simplex]|uniref:cubilin n=1 Tax=Anabrus simplex TaxID=316456 RepID=UPI0035A3559E
MSADTVSAYLFEEPSFTPVLEDGVWTSTVPISSSLRVSTEQQVVGYNYQTPRSLVNCSTQNQQSVSEVEDLAPSDIPCGAVYSSVQFRLTSPHFPASYPSNIRCSYLVQAVSASVCQLEVTFQNFFLRYSEGCEDEYLEIAGQRLCGSQVGVQYFRLSPPATTIIFKSGSQGNFGGGGFELLIRQRTCSPIPTSTPKPECGGIFSSRQFILQSPGYPRSYPENADCEYIVRSPPGQDTCYLQLEFLQFSLESSPGCKKDRLQIGSQEVLCGQVSGTKQYNRVLGNFRVRFVSDGAGNGRGFQISVIQLPCSSTTTIVPPTRPATTYYPTFRPPVTPNPQPPVYPYPPTNPHPPFNTLPPYPQPTVSTPSSQCCGTEYSGRHEYLVSPGFPYATRQNADCSYSINRFSSNTCQIRINFKFFSLGESDNYLGCRGGYLVIGNRCFCGCLTGNTVTLDARLGTWPKILRYVSDSRFNNHGFLLEIFQDDCQKYINYNPSSLERIMDLNNVISNETAQDSTRHFSLESVETDSDDTVNATNKEQFFVVHPLNSNETNWSEGNETRKKRFLWKPAVTDMSCGLWTLGSWLQYPSLCPISSQSVHCQDLGQLEGWIASPLYPRPYPGNMRNYYRIRRAEGYCRVELAVIDFGVEPSPNCEKDYLLVAGYRYCGTTLQATTSTFDQRDGHPLELLFVSDGTGSGRGFRARYQQIPCLSAPIQPENTPQSCQHTIRQWQFSVSSADLGPCMKRCTYKIIRAATNVCQLKLALPRFNIPCGQGYLQVGSERLCGPLHGRQFHFNFYSPELILELATSIENGRGLENSFLIQGSQLCDCVPPSQ